MSKDPATTGFVQLLTAAGGGDRKAASDLLPLVYGELRKLAEARMRHLPAGQTIQPTALVHEAYVKLVGDEDPGWNGKGHFFGAAANAMRELLVDHARRRGAQKRGGDRGRSSLDDSALSSDTPGTVDGLDLLALDRAIDQLQDRFPRASEIVMLRQFAGLNNPTIAEVMGVSLHIIERDWRFARAFMHKEMST